MTANIIISFLEEKKENFLEAKITSKLKGKKNEFDETARQTVRQENSIEADTKYSLDTWLENIIRKIKPNVTTHPAKFTNAKIDTDTSQIFLGKYQCDGYLKTGNVYLKNKIDVSGNSATNTIVFELYELLDRPIDENQKVVNKFEQDDESLKQMIEQLNGDFDLVKEKCLKVFYGQKVGQVQTHSSIRQIYFPLDNGEYHLLSVKTASMLMYEVKNRIKDIQNMWIDGEHARTYKKNNQFLEGGFSEFYDLTEIGYSPESYTKMGNYSFLNVKNRGISFLLSSCPPKIKERSIRLPKTDFFAQCLYRKQFQSSFMQLHKLMLLDINNVDIRSAIQNIIQFVIDQVLFSAYKIRQYSIGWSDTDYYQSLSLTQRIWLDDVNILKREASDEWRDDISREIARWILLSYEKIIHEGFKLGDGELIHVRKEVEDMLKKDKEYF